MDPVALRGVARRQSGARSAGHGRIGARRLRQVSGLALDRLAQCRRLYRRCRRDPNPVFAEARLARLRHPGGGGDEQPRLHQSAPTVPYRGADRPEAVCIMERLVDQAARETRIDPAELRKRNLIRPMPILMRRAPAGSMTPATTPRHWRSARPWRIGPAMPRGVPAAKPPANTAAAASPIMSTIPASSTSAWNCASTPAAK